MVRIAANQLFIWKERRRKKLGISAADMGKLIGVSGQSVYHWETGKTKPRASQLQAIAAVRKMRKRAVAAKLAAPD